MHAFPATGPHIPGIPGLVQESHGPLHGALQQMPPTQWLPIMQSESTLHVCPLFNFCATHFAPMQYGVVGAQFVPSFAAVQLMKHAVPLHANPPQSIGTGAVHVPPLQVEAAVSFPPEQFSAGHTVPHPPQFFASVLESVHVPAQIVIAGGVQPVTQP
jgi:hypothetical protein